MIQAFRKQHQLFESLFSHSTVAVWVTTITGQFERGNGAVLALLGLSETQFLATDYSSITHPEDVAFVTSANEELANGQCNNVSGNLRFVAHNGSVLAGRVSFSSIKNDDNTPTHVVALFTDVVVDELQNIELDQFRRFFSISRDLLCIAGSDAYFKVLNPRWTETLGYSQEELLTLPFLDLVHPDDMASTLNAMAMLNEGKDVIYFENRYRTKGGQYIWFAWTAASEPARGIYYAAARDISQLKHAETSLQKSNADLDNFAYVVSHDLKAPLRAINMLAAFIEEDLNELLPPASREHLNLLKNRVKRMEGLIQGILTFSRLGKDDEPRIAVDLNVLLPDVIEVLNPPTGVSIVLPNNLPTLNVQRVRMYQVWQNLIQNAIKYHDRSEGQIAIDWHQTETHHHFSVKDDGPGIDPRFHSRIFGVFQTIDARDAVESTGIGLSIVKRIIEENMAGEVWVESEIGQGATFHFTIAKTVD